MIRFEADEPFGGKPIADIELPPYLEGDLDDIPEVYLRTRYSEKNSTGDRFQRLRQAYGGAEGWKRWIQGYLASVAFVDEQFGRVLTLGNFGDPSPTSPNGAQERPAKNQITISCALSELALSGFPIPGGKPPG